VTDLIRPTIRPVIRIATRGSQLALWQANWARKQLEAQGLTCELVLIETQGDREQGPFAKMQGQGFFTKAVQAAVLEDRADVAVHSLKDLPSAITPGLMIAAIPEREDARDVLLANPEFLDASNKFGLKAGTILGTSAVRRRAQVEAIDPSLELRELRGNVPTRIEKLRRGEYGAIILAAAGLNRLNSDRLELNLGDLKTRTLEPHEFVPAPGQGALALECRTEDATVIHALSSLNVEHARDTVQVERGLMARLEGGCQLALGAHATREPNGWRLQVWYETIFAVQASSMEVVIEQAMQEIMRGKRNEERGK
jgi:hydroxymethylbilane synthase